MTLQIHDCTIGFINIYNFLQMEFVYGNSDRSSRHFIHNKGFMHAHANTTSIIILYYQHPLMTIIRTLTGNSANIMRSH